MTYTSQVEEGDLRAEEGYGLSRHATERALALDDTLPEAHSQMAWIKMTYDRDWAGAEAEFKKALALEPGNAPNLNGAAALLAAQGRLEEADELFRRALQVYPLNIGVYRNHGINLGSQGRLDEAVAVYQKTLELDPQYQNVHSLVAWVYLLQGKPEAALQEIQQETGEESRLYALALAYHALGRKAESDAALATYIEKHQDTFAYAIAALHARRGETDRAFEWLERAYAQRDRGLTWMKVDPDLKSVRNDPRWLPFLKKMRLAD